MNINTQNGTITLPDGRVASYMLERKHRWNIGLRRHVNELTGKVVVYWHNSAGVRVYSIFADFDHVRRATFN